MKKHINIDRDAINIIKGVAIALWIFSGILVLVLGFIFDFRTELFFLLGSKNMSIDEWNLIIDKIFISSYVCAAVFFLPLIFHFVVKKVRKKSYADASRKKMSNKK